MNCEHYESILMQMARKEILDSNVYLETEGHLKSCGNCRSYFIAQVELTGMLEDLRSLEDRVPAESLEKSLLEEFRKSRARKHSGWWILGKVAAVLLILWMGWLLFPRDHQSDSTVSNRLDETLYTDFFPLIHGDLSSEQLFLVRVRILRSSLLPYGVPVNADRTDEPVTADIVMSEMGIPQAIRLVEENESVRR